MNTRLTPDQIDAAIRQQLRPPATPPKPQLTQRQRAEIFRARRLAYLASKAAAKRTNTTR